HCPVPGSWPAGLRQGRNRAAQQAERESGRRAGKGDRSSVFKRLPLLRKLLLSTIGAHRQISSMRARISIGLHLPRPVRDNPAAAGDKPRSARLWRVSSVSLTPQSVKKRVRSCPVTVLVAITNA